MGGVIGNKANHYVLVTAPLGHPRAIRTAGRPQHTRGQLLEHVAVAEQALGRPLPAKAEVHHVNRLRYDNRNRNLVICQDRSYHRLLHVRLEAFKACGDVTWRKCQFCKTYDAPERMYVTKKMVYHRDCLAAYRREQRAAA